MAVIFLYVLFNFLNFFFPKSSKFLSPIPSLFLRDPTSSVVLFTIAGFIEASYLNCSSRLHQYLNHFLNLANGWIDSVRTFLLDSKWYIAALKGKCKRGEAIKCGDKIRLMHLTTKCLLHSHMFNAPLSRGNQEVSCFGKNGEGDTGDHWIVTCNTDEWLRGEPQTAADLCGIQTCPFITRGAVSRKVEVKGGTRITGPYFTCSGLSLLVPFGC
ncbi:unnamed protein product [Toxocara canis]|uniref:MIR domain-containing protein n=1 Tax=Toxocara canis TaxID=6265 RepID=A0A183U4W2_TOXCA|nr:unnamed protein product [Toxocara canis]